MVRVGIRGINTMIALERGTQPLHQIDEQHYIKPIQYMLAGFKNFDPATEKNLVCHPDLPEFAQAHAYKIELVAQHVTGDLIAMAFYYLLRIGEYTTKTKQKMRTRTRQFCEKDVTLFKVRNGWMCELPCNASAADVMSADAATLRI